MPADGRLTPARRDALLVGLALGLLAAPLWVPALHLDDPTYRYASVAVETDGAEMGFATAPDDPLLGISDRIACAGDRWGRTCVFEHSVAANHTVPTRIYASRERGFREDVLDHRYRFALLNGTVYRVGAVPNATVTGHGGHRLDLALRPVEAERALTVVSVDVEDIAPPLRRAARNGHATGHVEELPATTVQLDEHTYRRVYIANATRPPEHNAGTESLLGISGPLVGLGLLGWLRTRYVVTLSVTHVSGP